jgi:UDPglucose 6-dehydrogenase
MGIKKKVRVMGLGYVGLANLAFLSLDRRLDVSGFDPDTEKIESLKKGLFYLHEPMSNQVLATKLSPSSYSSDSASLIGADIYVIAVGTPTKPSGEADLSFLWDAISLVKEGARRECVVLVRSTVPPKTCQTISDKLNENEGCHFHAVSFPEFLSEGHAFEDEQTPSRFVVGSMDKEGFDCVRYLRENDIANGIPMFEMSCQSSELSKYAANLFLSMKISFINELSRLSEQEGADIGDIALAMGSDPRIGRSMLKAGVGFGGSCFPKDGAALLSIGKKDGVCLSLVSASQEVNRSQTDFFLMKIKRFFPSLKNQRIALLGLSYKSGTSDIRHSPSLDIAAKLIKEGAEVVAFDPSPLARWDFAKEVDLSVMAVSLTDALSDADAVVILTEDPLFASLDENALLKIVRGRFIFDGRNLYPLYYFKYFNYVSIGRKDILHL